MKHHPLPHHHHHHHHSLPPFLSLLQHFILSYSFPPLKRSKPKNPIEKDNRTENSSNQAEKFGLFRRYEDQIIFLCPVNDNSTKSDHFPALCSALFEKNSVTASNSVESSSFMNVSNPAFYLVSVAANTTKLSRKNRNHPLVDSTDKVLGAGIIINKSVEGRGIINKGKNQHPNILTFTENPNTALYLHSCSNLPKKNESRLF